GLESLETGINPAIVPASILASVLASSLLRRVAMGTEMLQNCRFFWRFPYQKGTKKGTGQLANLLIFSTFLLQSG
ncbi:MAG: hypothetical protein IJ925_10100, partial [Muribaculaceae bacterium]|nr:hypothetical protein [Muribaculaceae bacterium]